MHNLPMTEDQTIEQKIVAQGLTAPRVTPDELDANIASIHFFNAAQAVRSHDWETDQSIDPLRLLTFCVLVLQNGFTVTGESACASPENFDAGIGKDIAFANAKAKIWPLMGYALKEKLAGATNA